MNTTTSVTIVLVFMLFKIQYGSFQSIECMEKINEDFEDVVKRKYFVDKSDLLKEILSDATDRSTWILNFPKGFGKTTNMNMIRKFAEIEMNAEGSPITQNLINVTNTPNYEFFTRKYDFGYFNIANDSDFMRRHFGAYPVIYMDFRTTRPIQNYTDVVEICRQKIHQAFLQHQYLLNSKNLDYDYKENFKVWIQKSQLSQLDKYSVIEGLQKLIELLYMHFQQRVIVLIDEYDAIVQSYLTGQDIVNEPLQTIFNPFMDMLGSALKDQVRLRVAVLTGLTSISNARIKENVPNIEIHRFGREEMTKFWKYYGFTSEDLDRLFSISPFKLNSTVRDQVEKYYGGYLINNVHIYNPTSIIQFFTNEEIKPFWNMESQSIINTFWETLLIIDVRLKIFNLIDNQNVTIKNLGNVDIEDLLYLKGLLETNSLKADTTGRSKRNIFFNFLLDLGYLKITWQNHTYWRYPAYLNVTIPNLEIRDDMIRLLKEYEMSTPCSDEELILQDKIFQHLQSLTADNHTYHLQEITSALNKLSKLAMPFNPSFKKETVLTVMLHWPFLIQGIRCYSQVSVEGHSGCVDLLVKSLANVYIIIKTKYNGTSSEALTQTNQYVSVLDDSDYKQTQNCVLQMGINVCDDYKITVSAILNITNGTSYGPYHFPSFPSTTTIKNDFRSEISKSKIMPLKKRRL
ncbi:uncharacterized protein LOC135838940 [Planococcus citri]|uniref:uncharacterized protein LOC135838940 n=1 Tax=Planococcus citri TaxID=170843 RepID=UPI0031F99AA1